MLDDALSPAALDGLWDFDDPAATEERFREALAQALRDPDGALVCEALTQIARTQGLQRRFDDARLTLARADEAADPSRPRDRVRILLEQGRVDNSGRADGRGREHFVAAWELARAAGEDALAVDAAHMLGIVCEPATAKGWNERAMELARTSDDPGARRWRPTLANNMGWALHDAGAHEQALALFREALDGRVEQGDATTIRIARWSVARCLRSLDRVDEALAEQESLAAELAETGATDGYVTEERAECLLALGRGEEARPLFAQAHAELSADVWLADAEPERLARLAALGGL